MIGNPSPGAGGRALEGVPMPDLHVSREAVLRAMEEFDRVGRQEFLDRYGFGEARRYFLEYNGKQYDSKAIVGVARGFDQPALGSLTAAEFSGGQAIKRVLEDLGFTVRRVGGAARG